MNGVPRIFGLVLAFGCLLHSFVASQTAGDGRSLERRGLYEEALVVYRNVLANDSDDLASWLGLERVYLQLGQTSALISLLDSTIASKPHNSLFHEILLRVWSSLNEPDSIDAAARRWIALSPDREEPFRQWAYVVAREGRRAYALDVLTQGREVLGEDALAGEIAQILGASGNWVASATEWAIAIEKDGSLVAAAGFSLRQVDETARDSVLQVLLDRDRGLIAQRLGAELLVAWNRPEEGWTRLANALPQDVDVAASELRMFADRVKRLQTTEGARARGYALERGLDHHQQRRPLLRGAERRRGALLGRQRLWPDRPQRHRDR